MYVVKRIIMMVCSFSTLLIADHSKAIKIDLVSLPKVPDVHKIAVPSVKIISENSQEDVKSLSNKEDKIKIGDIDNGYLSAYIIVKYTSDEDFYQALKRMKYEILSIYPIGSDGNYEAVAFSNVELIKKAAAPLMGFSAVLRALIDKKHKTISITNPKYIFKAFSFDKYDEAFANKQLDKLRANLQELKNSSDRLKFAMLPTYRMFDGMPRYLDMKMIAQGKHTTLVQKLQNSPKLVYILQLDATKHLAAVRLSKATENFVQTIGYKNAQILPYQILIENNKAMILDPKYYIGVMYPDVSTDQFMKIHHIPDAIYKECSDIMR